MNDEMAVRSEETPDRKRPIVVDSAEEGGKMPITPLARVLYTAEAVTEGGRAGVGRTTDGRLDLQLSVPEDMGGPGGPALPVRQRHPRQHPGHPQRRRHAPSAGRSLTRGRKRPGAAAVSRTPGPP